MGERPIEERRRAPRIILREPVGGTIFTTVEATIVNVSTTGALLEHAQAVRIGQPYILTVTLSPREVRVRCRIIRSGIHEIRPRGAREPAVVYRTGVEFLDATAEDLQVLQEWVQTRPD